MRNLKLTLGTLVMVLFFTGTVLAQTSGKIEIGNEVDVKISTNHPYNLDKTGVVFEKEFSKEGSGYIKLFFAGFDLAEGDYVEVNSPKTGETFIYQGKGKVVRNGGAVISDFWTSGIWSDQVIVRLHSKNVENHKYGFDITKVAYGYSPSEIEKKLNLKAIQGNDDKDWAKCHQGTTMYEKSKPVIRMLISGRFLCTGWLIGSEGHMMTNNHCIENQREADNTDFEFMAEGSTCQTNCPQLQCRGTREATSGRLIKTNADYDYSLVKLPGNLSTKYGYLSFRATRPKVGERIYIPQHPGGKGKQISVFDDQTNGNAKIEGVNSSVTYYADTEGGSSGSPVIAYSDHLVVALHHAGNSSRNYGVRNTNIIRDLGNSMPANGVSDGSTTPTCSDGIKNGDETGVDCGGSCPNSCAVNPTCNDGIQNGDETGVDCGGSCPNTCSDPGNDCPAGYPYYACGRCWVDAAQAVSGGCNESAEINEINMAVYPNPVNDVLFIQGIAQDISYKVFNGTGTTVFEGKGNVLNTSEFASGLFILKTEGGETIRFIKK